MPKSLRVLAIILICLILPGSGAYAQSQKKKAPASKTQPAPQKSGTKKGTPPKGTQKKRKASAPKRETSASVQKRQRALQGEVAATQKKIEANDREVSTNLATLQTLETDVAAQERRLKHLHLRRADIDASIRSAEQAIAQGEERLALMRSQYINAVKRMRSVKKRLNPLAYIFSSKDFYQAMRRLRYLNKFNAWRRKRETMIKKELEALQEQRARLDGSQKALALNIAGEQETQGILAAKRTEQAATVARLRADGQALRTLLARKQAEANALGSQVAALIAREQAEAAAAEKKRKELAEAQARKREQETAAKKKREEEAARKRAAEQAAEQKKKEELALAQQKKEIPPAEKKESPKKEPKPKKEAPTSTPKKEKSYADARGRQARKPKDSGKPSTKPAEKPADKPAEKPSSSQGEKPAQTPRPAPTAPTGFAAAKGALPRPVAGSFSIISRFGRHPLPDMPEVMYDNPGIDAVVGKGAKAQAVYAGTVSGIYSLPGYNTVVIVSHGDYYTVYGGIGQPAVAKGAQVKAGQSLGNLVADPAQGGRTTIHFEVWKNREKLNPEAWIR